VKTETREWSPCAGRQFHRFIELYNVLAVIIDSVNALKLQVPEDDSSVVSLRHFMNISPYSIQQVNKYSLANHNV